MLSKKPKNAVVLARSTPLALTLVVDAVQTKSSSEENLSVNNPHVGADVVVLVVDVVLVVLVVLVVVVVGQADEAVTSPLSSTLKACAPLL